jgi:hypothetical protein
MSRMDWGRCKARGRATESKYGNGVILQNGSRTQVVVKDSLAQRADRAMQLWQRKLNSADRQRVRYAAPDPSSKPHKHYELRAQVSNGGRP